MQPDGKRNADKGLMVLKLNPKPPRALSIDRFGGQELV